MTAVFGFLNINKPAGMTSHDVVAQIRRAFKLKKVGHAGTLDPLATGVLVICLGGATRLSEYVMHSTKNYRAQVRLGVSTTTYDAEGEIVAVRDSSALTYDDVQTALATLQGPIDQIPPMYSAVKKGGRKLYELARAGQVVEREARAVTIESLKITDWSPPQVTLEVVCSAGTYIRSLAYDLGERLGVGAHLSGLTRLASGQFRLENALGLDTVLTCTQPEQLLLTPRIALAPMPEVHLNAAAADDVRHGRRVEDETAQSGHLVQAYSPDGQFIAILQGEDACWRPHRVFA
jgi:tRNA pseudouridine55 synthase